LLAAAASPPTSQVCLYDLVVLAHNSVTGNFDQWRIVRITLN
jgi:hypothetical protein